MFRSKGDSWSFFMQLILKNTYQSLQNRIITGYYPYRYIVKQYSSISKRNVYPITEEHVLKNPETTDHNISLLKNAIELFRIATDTTDAVAPILYHYSWHCFNSFLSYSFFRWVPKHADSHGIRISKWSNNIEEIEIQFTKRGGSIFQRLIDTWALLGRCVAFSPFFAIYKNDEIIFIPNNHCLIDDSYRLTVKKLLSLDTKDFVTKIRAEIPFNKIIRPKPPRTIFLEDVIVLPTNFIKNYLILFIASSLARYRPVLWNSVLIGETYEQSKFALSSRRAILDYTDGFEYGLGLVNKVSELFNKIFQGEFGFEHL